MKTYFIFYFLSLTVFNLFSNMIMQIETKPNSIIEDYSLKKAVACVRERNDRKFIPLSVMAVFKGQIYYEQENKYQTEEDNYYIT